MPQSRSTKSHQFTQLLVKLSKTILIIYKLRLQLLKQNLSVSSLRKNMFVTVICQNVM